jgi:transposase
MDHYAGIDISKNRLDLCILDETGDTVLEDQLANNETGYGELAELVDEDAPIGLEVGTLASPVHDYLVERDYTVRLGDSQRMKTIWECDQKFDGKDAFETADLVRIDKFPEVLIPDPSVLEARELIRARKDGVEQATQARQRLGSYLRREGIQPPFEGKTVYSENGHEWLRERELDPRSRSLVEAHLAQIEALEPRVEELDQMVAGLIVDDAIVDRLVSVPGVGLHDVAVLRYDIGSMEQFDTIDRFRACAGGAPRNRQSGGAARQEGPVRRCNKQVRAAVGIAAESAATKTKGDNSVEAMFQRQMGLCKPRSSALGHARGRLATGSMRCGRRVGVVLAESEHDGEQAVEDQASGPPGLGFVTASPPMTPG